MKKRNGNIELMRFVFCVVIILFHINSRIDVTLPSVLPGEYFSFFRRGCIGVEFFFLVSGYFMAASAKKNYETKSIARSTQSFMYKKFLGIYPYHIVACVTNIVLLKAASILISHKNVSRNLLAMVPELFLVDYSGIYAKHGMTTAWYLGAMLLMMLFMYPLILKYEDAFTKIIAPICTVLLVGYLMKNTGKLNGIFQFVFDKSIAKVYVRAFAVMCAGAFAYEVANRLKKVNFNKVERGLLTVLETVCYLFALYYCCSQLDKKYDAYALYALCIAITITFSEVGYFNNCFNNKFVYFLGKASFPIYLTQDIAFYFLKLNIKSLGVGTKIIAVFVIDFALAVFVYITGNYIKKYIDSKVHNKKIKA